MEILIDTIYTEHYLCVGERKLMWKTKLLIIKVNNKVITQIQYEIIDHDPRIKRLFRRAHEQIIYGFALFDYIQTVGRFIKTAVKHLNN